MSRNACSGENPEKSSANLRFKLDDKSGPLESADFGENSPKIHWNLLFVLFFLVNLFMVKA